MLKEEKIYKLLCEVGWLQMEVMLRFTRFFLSAGPVCAYVRPARALFDPILPPQAFFTQEAIDGIVNTTFGEKR